MCVFLLNYIALNMGLDTYSSLLEDPSLEAKHRVRTVISATFTYCLAFTLDRDEYLVTVPRAVVGFRIGNTKGQITFH